MAESLTISRTAPAVGSMNYALLRELGIKRLQELSGNTWTDFNIHDPGVTMLEALAYAITDLGYRSSYKMQDILALDPSSSENIRNFFTAYDVLTNHALTIDDYRKLLIDVQVENSDGVKAGVKNAWLLKSDVSEIPFYPHPKKNILSYDPDPTIPNQESVRIRGLYNVLLEFDENERFGDMNENIMTGVMQIVEDTSINGPIDPKLLYKKVVFELTLPRWDVPGVDFKDQDSIREFINKNIIIDFSEFPDNYVFNYSINPATGEIENLDGYEDKDRDGMMLIFFTDIANLQDQINEFLYNTTTGLVAEYQKKVFLTLQLVAEVRRVLMANRNLCEDFLNLSAVKVEEIAMCGDIQIKNDADIEEVLANIYHEIGRFLSPTVYFHSLDEMIARGKTTDEIFLGPKLKHGFVDDEELDKAGFREAIHVSDFYRIIMRVPGVVAVKQLQIANFPEGNENIPSKSVKWCLDLAFSKNFVPRLSIERSNIAIFKELLPFEPNEPEVISRVLKLKLQDPPQRLENPVLDIPIPQGEFKELDSYTSVQEEFPLVYGIGAAGLPDSATPLRKSQAHQLKGFLMFFDQLLRDYLSQLSHVKDLFSLNEGRDNDGDFIIGRTYYSQTLFNIVPDAASLYVNTQPTHVENLNLIAEDETLFESRRNRFLDHLLARFGETFTDYAMLTFTIDGPKAPEELIEDKLRFLNDYPRASSGRSGAFDYADTCLLWNADNVSGLEERVSLLTGIDPFLPADLSFPTYIDINSVAGDPPFSFDVKDNVAATIMINAVTYSTLDEVMLAVEKMIVTGLFLENYKLFKTGDPTPIDVDPTNFTLIGTFKFKLFCDGEVIAVSNGADALIGPVIAKLTSAIASFQYEYESRPSSNRNDLDCALEENVVTSISTPIPPAGCPNIKEILYTLQNDASPQQDILTYTQSVAQRATETGPEFDARVNALLHDLYLEFLIEASNRLNYRLEVNGANDYIFSVTDSCANSIASSVETDFNFNLANSSLNGSIKVYNENGSEIAGPFTLSGSASNNDKIDTSISPALPGSYTGGKISKDFTFTINSVDAGRKKLFVNEDLRGRVKEGDIIIDNLITATYPDFTVVKVAIIDFSPGAYVTELTVKETFVGTAVASHTFGNRFFLPVIAVPATNQLVLKGGVDEIAIDEFIAYINMKFLGHEGMHLIEHVLLRPTTKKKVFDPATDTSMATITNPQGDLFFVKKVPIFAVDKINRIFKINANITSEIMPLQTIIVSGSNLGYNDRNFTVQSRTFTGGNTEIKVVESISDDTVSFGDISYTKKVSVGSVATPPNASPIVTINATNLVGEIIPGDVIIVKNSNGGRNDNRYIAGTVTFTSPNTAITIDKTEVEHKDNFLLINQIAGCEDCRYEDPYSFIISVILPFWRGRFSNIAFRNFFERTLRLETPAHIALNICWIGCEQMKDFEKRYKQWLYQHALKVKDVVALSDAQHALIETLQGLHTVYPKATLHDCEREDKVKNSIILNRTALGTI